MATTLPTITETIDNAFLHTWYEIRPEAIDNILDATVMWAALRAAGCMKEKVGGRFITRTVRYDFQEATEVQKGDTLPQGEKEVETMARWTWRYIASHVQRDAFDDQINAGPDAIKELVGTKLDSARDGLEQKFETSLFNTIVTGETGKLIQGLNDMVPPVASRSTGTYGAIARPSAYVDSGNGVFVGDPAGTNGWWGPKYLDGTLATIEDDLIEDMKKLYNSVHNNQSPPNLIVTDQTIYELYEDFGLDHTQIIKGDMGMQLVDLGFEVLKFKGKPMIYTPNTIANTMLFLNTNYIELIYDPRMWFDMTAWKPVPLEPRRIAHIMCASNLISSQLRRHGRLTYS